jgi:hypothetical protein
VVRERRVSSAAPRSAAIEHRGRSARASRLNASLDRMALAGFTPLGLQPPARRSQTDGPAPDGRRQPPCSSTRPQSRRPPAPQPRQAQAPRPPVSRARLLRLARRATRHKPMLTPRKPVGIREWSLGPVRPNVDHKPVGGAAHLSPAQHHDLLSLQPI